MSYNVDERVFSFFTESESTRTKNELYGSFAIQSVHKARSYITQIKVERFRGIFWSHWFFSRWRRQKNMEIISTFLNGIV